MTFKITHYYGEDSRIGTIILSGDATMASAIQFASDSNLRLRNIEEIPDQDEESTDDVPQTS